MILSGASACPPLRTIPEWCNNYGGGVVEMANVFGWGNECLPYTEAELLADNDCIRRKTLTDPKAIAISKAADKELKAHWPDEARCIEAHPRLTWAFGQGGCSAGDLMDKTGIPAGAWLAIGALGLVLLLRK